jgi:MFS family permease
MWKFFAITNALMSSFTQGFGPLALAPMFGYYIVDFNSNLADVIQFTGVAILVLGFSNLFWIPTSSRYGRRVVLIASGSVCVASNIWRAVATDYNSFMGASA